MLPCTVMTDQHKTSVFVVDDEWIISSTLATILERAGFHATSFTSPIVALSLVEVSCPDILITDVAMPEMNGIDLAIQFRLKSPKCKILLFSGQSGTADLLDKAHKQGYEFDILAKPVHPKELLAAIRNPTE